MAKFLHILANVTVYCYYFVIHFVAPVCFNTTYCGGESVIDNLLSFEQCCFELSGASFASSGQCRLCPETGILISKLFFSVMITINVGIYGLVECILLE